MVAVHALVTLILHYMSCSKMAVIIRSLKPVLKVEANGSIMLADLQRDRISRFISQILKNENINLLKIFDSLTIDL